MLPSQWTEREDPVTAERLRILAEIEQVARQHDDLYMKDPIRYAMAMECKSSLGGRLRQIAYRVCRDPLMNTGD